MRYHKRRLAPPSKAMDHGPSAGGMCSPDSQGNGMTRNDLKTSSQGKVKVLVSKDSVLKDCVSKDSVLKDSDSKDPKEVHENFPKDLSKNVPKKVPKKTQKVPKFTDAGTCSRCKSHKNLDESISCSLCGDLFHALCRDARGRLEDEAICTKSLLDMIRPAVADYGKHAQRWGNFMFLCKKCKKKVQSLSNSQSNESINTSNTLNLKNVVNKDDVTMIDCSCNTEPNETVNVEEKDVTTDDRNHNSDNHVIASVSSIVTRNVQSMFSTMKDDFLASVDERIAERLQSALTINSPLSSTFARRRVPSNVSTPCSEEFSSPSIPSDNLLSSVSSSSIELSSSDESSTKSYGDAVKESLEHHTADYRKLLPLPMKTSSSYTMSTSKSSGNTDEVFTEDSDLILVLNANDETVNLHKAEEKVNDLFKNVQTNNIKNNIKSRKIVMFFPTKVEKEKGRKVLEKHPEIASKNMTLNDAKKMFPKITVANIPNYLVSDILSEQNLEVPAKREKLRKRIEACFMEKNEHLKDLVMNHGRTFQIIYVNSSNNDTTVGIKVSPDIRHHLIEAQCIFIGNTRCKVRDRFDLKQCYKCQQFGHKSEHCKENHTVCKYCSASHATRNCPHKYDREKHRCINCSHSSIEQYKALCHTHHSSADSCPIIMMEKDNLRKKTEYSKNM